jgi:hypothetical protein
VDIKLDVLEFLCRCLFTVGRCFRDGVVCAEDFERFAAACGSVLVALLEFVASFFFRCSQGTGIEVEWARLCNGCVSACACGRVMSVPGVGDDDVVEGRMTLAEARETDFENHGRKIFVCCFVFEGGCLSKGLSIAETIWCRRCKRRLSR